MCIPHLRYISVKFMKGETWYYEGATPSRLRIRNWPQSEDQFYGLTQLLPHTSFLKVDILTVMDPATYVSIRSLGPLLANIEALSFRPRGRDRDAPTSVLVAWAPHMHKLRQLDFTITSYPDIILDELAPQLRHLRLRQALVNAEDPFSLSALRNRIAKLSALERLVLPWSTSEVGEVAARCVLASNSLAVVFEPLSALLPPQLQDLAGVFVNWRPGGFIPLAAHVFLGSTGSVAPMLAKFMSENALLNKVRSQQGATPLITLLRENRFLRGTQLIRDLIAAGADPWIRCDIDFWSNVADKGNALFVAALGTLSHRIVELFSLLDWEAVGKDPSKIRSDFGFTVMHSTRFYSPEAWQLFYDAISLRFPQVLSDRLNVANMTPIETYHSHLGANTIAPPTHIEIIHQMLQKHPGALQETSPGFFATAFKFWEHSCPNGLDRPIRSRVIDFLELALANELLRPIDPNLLVVPPGTKDAPLHQSIADSLTSRKLVVLTGVLPLRTSDW